VDGFHTLLVGEMKMNYKKWIAVLLPAVFVGFFEIFRHDVLGSISVGLGNVMVAGVAALTSLMYYYGIFNYIESLNMKLQEEKEEKATLSERDRIARELHDSVSQALFFMNIKAQAIEASVSQGKKPLEEVIELRKAVKITDADVRQHIFDLQIASQVNIDFISTIQSYLMNFQEQSGIKTDLNIIGNMDGKLNKRTINQLIRIFQEVLWNVRKHADASWVMVQLTEESSHAVMTITDDGKGLDMNDLKQKKSSFGLKIIEERAASIGAELKINSEPGKGTTVLIHLPFETLGG
jgi:signal transduction histidine kinase